VPLSTKADKLLRKYNYKIPSFWEQVVNRHLKQIGDMIGLSNDRASKIFGAAIIISERTLNELKDKEGNVPFAYCPLGKVKVKGKEEAVRIYDLYEGEIVRVRQLKAQNQKEFEQGIHHYFNRQFGKSAEEFKVVLENNPEDVAAQYYLDKCVDYIVNDVPENWDGVEEMLLK
jgi:two-component system sensor histidine kinase ChiS